MVRVASAFALVSLAAGAAPPAYGPYATKEKTYKVTALDKGGEHQRMYVYYPSNATAGEKFPLISYAHGMLSGAFGPIEYLSTLYGQLFPQLASHGFIVAAPATCNTDGCADHKMPQYTDCAGLPPVAPRGWESYYGEQLKTIDWAHNTSETDDPILSMMDWEAGVGIAGHSMGGQATTISSHSVCTEKWNIKAAVLHHSANGATPLGNLGVNVSVPMLAMGSSGDASCTAETREIFESSPVHPKAFRNEKGFSHLEPMVFNYNPPIATFTAAWFKVYLNGDKGDYYDMIYDWRSPSSLCNYAEMKECIVSDPATVAV